MSKDLGNLAWVFHSQMQYPVHSMLQVDSSDSKRHPSMKRSSSLTTLLTSIGAVLATASMATAQANFEPFTLDSAKIAVSVGGSTGGTTSIPAITGSTDRAGNKCLGFGDPNPDHLMTLKSRLSNLTLKVNSGGRDTTLVIQGPNGELRCGDDTGSKKDASVSDSDWEPGVYKVWVGSMESGGRGNYRLTTQGN